MFWFLVSEADKFHLQILNNGPGLSTPGFYYSPGYWYYCWHITLLKMVEWLSLYGTVWATVLTAFFMLSQCDPSTEVPCGRHLGNKFLKTPFPLKHLRYSADVFVCSKERFFLKQLVGFFFKKKIGFLVLCVELLNNIWKVWNDNFSH